MRAPAAFLLLLVVLAAACTSQSDRPVEYRSLEDEFEADVPLQVQEVGIGDILAQKEMLEGLLVSTSGRVERVVQAQGYTYVKLVDGNASVWAAGPQAAVREGMLLNLSSALVMLNFSAGALNTTLDVMLMTDSLIPAQVINVSVPKLEGGYTVAEVLQRAEELEGREVRVRGVVTKVLPGIMNLTWVHLKDGTSAPAGDELVLTAPEAEVSVGDVVVATGRVEMNVDIGYHTVFRVLLSNATFVRENLNTSAG